MPALTTEEIAALEKTIGEAGTRISSFNQRGYPGEGICHGMCLDWVRRILGGKTTRFDKYDALGSDEKARKIKKRLATQEQTHEIRLTALDTVQAPLRKEITEQVARSKSATFGLQLRSFPLLGNPIADMFGYGTEQQLDADKRDAHTKVTAVSRQVVPSQIGPVYWSTFQQLWSQNVRGRTGGAKNINFDLLSGSILGKSETVADWSSYFDVRLSGLPASDCAIFMGEGKSGHAIAFHRRPSATIEFFEPNFGEYEFKSQNALVTVLVMLSSTVYHFAGGSWNAFSV